MGRCFYPGAQSARKPPQTPVEHGLLKKISVRSFTKNKFLGAAGEVGTFFEH